jgi:hypothetical protein
MVSKKKSLIISAETLFIIFNEMSSPEEDKRVIQKKKNFVHKLLICHDRSEEHTSELQSPK